MSELPGRARWRLWALGAGAAAVVVLAVWLSPWLGQQPSPDGPFPIPPYSESRHLNTGPEVGYVGIAACAECHRARHQSYLLTAHSRALADLDEKAEPPDGSFDHKPSGCSYRVYRRDGLFRIEETLRTPEGKEISRVDLPARYLIGSGHFSRSYLVEVDGFLHEAPVTWYASTKRWGVSPGYDVREHWGFERPAKVTCLVCHVGRVEPVNGSVHRLAILEKAIGCESCHGPGEKHAAFHRADNRRTGDEDLTIVNPGKLSRSRLESVCAACHLSSAASVYLRGREVTDFRPGMPLTDYRLDYRLGGNDQMTVVGHVEQLRQSACYQKSEGLTCVTCHDPHAAHRPKDPVAFYRQKCLGCHTDQACRLPRARRLEKEPADSCAACHMPRGDTDIPHIAFTHHKIGRHPGRRPAAGTAEPPGQVPELVPLDDDSHLPPLERQRNLGHAYMDVVRKPEYSRYADVFRARARELLEGVADAGLREGKTAQALAELYWKTDTARGRMYAQEALAAKDSSPDVRVTALALLATCEARGHNFKEAITHLEEAVRLRRCSEDWGFLGACYLAENQPREALPALLRALSIRPDRAVVHAGLAEAYRRLGDDGRAREHRDKAERLTRQRQP